MSYKLELHAHSRDVSACASAGAEDIVGVYVEAGYDGIVLSNHFSNYTMTHMLGSIDSYKEKIKFYIDAADKIRDVAKGKLDVILGCEITISDSYNDYLLFGFDEDVLFNEELLKMNISSLSAFCRENGILLFQAHPFRNNMKVIQPKYIDGIEVYNGHIGHDSRNTLAEMWADRFGLMKSSGSDFHDPSSKADGGIIIPSRITTQKELKEVILGGNYQLVKEIELP